MGGEAVRYASPLLNLHIASGPLSARVIAGGEGGARAKRGRVRWAPTLAPQTSRAYQAPPHPPPFSPTPTSPPHCFAMGPFLSPASRRRGPKKIMPHRGGGESWASVAAHDPSVGL